MTRLRAALGRRQRGDDNGFVMILTIMLILIVAALSVTITGIVINQTRPTQLAQKNVRTINAAAAGLQVALNQLRTAVNAVGAGSLTALPCTATNSVPFTASGQPAVTTDGALFAGAVSPGSKGGLTYSASVAYFASNPSNQSTTWLRNNQMTCPLSAVPSYAYIQTRGAGAAVPGSKATAANRTEHATYKFANTNTNTVGGRIKEFGVTPLLCMDAGAAPAVGTPLTMQSCLAIGTASQTWQYRNDLTLFYGGDITKNLCVQRSASGTKATLQTCVTNGLASTPTYPYVAGQQAQEWGFNDSGHFSTANSDGTVTNGSGGTCLQPAGANDTVAAVVNADVLTTVCNGGTTGLTAWNPDPQVGAGKAGGNTSGSPGPATYQYVNYFEFGRCLDITGQNVNADHLIDYPCKQSPDSSKLTFNQVWGFSVVAGTGGYGTMSVSGKTYCLQAPLSVNNYVTTKACNSALDTQQWLPTGQVVGNYSGSYNLVNKATGKCMAADPTNQLTFLSSTIIIAPCDGGLKQKWNAPPDLTNPGPADVSEDNGAN